MLKPASGTGAIILLYLPGQPGLITEREFEVLECLWEGLSNKEAGEKLFISKRTVETHREKLFSKTKCKTLLQFIKFLYKNKWVDTDGNIKKENIPLL